MRNKTHVGVTICVDEEKRSFVRLDMETEDIDPEGDVEAQAQTALTAHLSVIKILDDGVHEALTDVIMGASEPGLVKDTLEALQTKVDKIGRVLTGPNGVILKTKQLIDEGKALTEKVDSFMDPGETVDVSAEDKPKPKSKSGSKKNA